MGATQTLQQSGVPTALPGKVGHIGVMRLAYDLQGGRCRAAGAAHEVLVVDASPFFQEQANSGSLSKAGSDLKRGLTLLQNKASTCG